MKKILQQLLTHPVLSRSEAAVFITVYLMRRISPDELFGFRDALLEMCVPVNLRRIPVTDLCGAGGDGKNTLLNLRMHGYEGFLMDEIFMREADPARACIRLITTLKLNQQISTV